MIFEIIIGFLSVIFIAVGGGLLIRGADLDGDWGDTTSGLICLLLGILCMVLCLVCASNHALSEERGRATEAGVAQYVADGNTGEVRFEYIKLGGKE